MICIVSELLDHTHLQKYHILYYILFYDRYAVISWNIETIYIIFPRFLFHSKNLWHFCLLQCILWMLNGTEILGQCFDLSSFWCQHCPASLGCYHLGMAMVGCLGLQQCLDGWYLYPHEWMQGFPGKYCIVIKRSHFPSQWFNVVVNQWKHLL